MNWFQHPMFNSYWKHYSACNEWLRQSNVKPMTVDLSAGEICQKDKQCDPQDGAEGYCFSSPEVVQDYDSDDIEISAEYLKFVAETRRHQAERRKMKAIQRRQEKNIVYQDIGKMESSSRVQDMNEKQSTQAVKDNDWKKKLQMAQWYGSHADDIQVLEMDLESRFHDFIRDKNPVFFPFCPINMKKYFDDTN